MGITDHKLRLAVLISGSGRTLQNFIDLSHAGKLPATIVLAISSRPGVTGIQRALAAHIPTEIIVPRSMSAKAFSEKISGAVDAADADLVCLAGFLSKWIIPPRYMNRVMNIHPALLPKYGGRGFYGHHVHEAVLASGDAESGCTVHFADNEYDHGPIILQHKVPVLSDDTPDLLARRVFEQECLAYPEAIQLFAQQRLVVRGNRVEILRGHPSEEMTGETD